MRPHITKKHVLLAMKNWPEVIDFIAKKHDGNSSQVYRTAPASAT